MQKSVVGQKSYSFAIKIVNLYKELILIKEFVLSRQLLKSGTSIGANITEANGAISESDFSAKMSIAYKEALETKYWLNLLKDTNYITIEKYNVYFQEADEICKILFSILKTTRIEKQNKSK